MWWTKKRRMTASCGLAVLSVVFALIRRSAPCALAAAAMMVSFFGDALLAGVPGRLAQIRNRLVKGGLVFLAAHLLYISALVIASGRSLPALLPSAAPFLALALALTALHGALFYFRPRAAAPRSFFWAASAYLMTAGVHAAFAAATAAVTGGYALNAAGAALFFLSDAILLAGKYGAVGGDRATDPIWFTYAPAQLCILIGFFLGAGI